MTRKSGSVMALGSTRKDSILIMARLDTHAMKINIEQGMDAGEDKKKEQLTALLLLRFLARSMSMSLILLTLAEEVKLIANTIPTQFPGLIHAIG